MAAISRNGSHTIKPSMSNHYHHQPPPSTTTTTNNTSDNRNMPITRSSGMKTHSKMKCKALPPRSMALQTRKHATSQLDDDRKVKKQQNGNQKGDSEVTTKEKKRKGAAKTYVFTFQLYILIFSPYCRKTSSDKARADDAAILPSQLTK
jgi:hypothetical protein